MSITDPGSIDLVATRPGTEQVRLVITDHLPWDDVQAHCLLLQEKLNTYIAFVESGEVYELSEPRVPNPAQFAIMAATQHEPPPEAEGFFEQVAQILDGIGMSLLIRSSK